MITVEYSRYRQQDFRVYNLKHKLDRSVSKYGRVRGGRGLGTAGRFGTMNNEARRCIECGGARLREGAID